jgi:dTDP-4-dehydrorhamnose 3,5-epimerase
MKPLGIEGAWTREATVFRDDRGSFHEWFGNSEISAAIGRDLDVRQANCAISKKGAVRGIHYTSAPPGQSKYFICVRGAALGAVVDIRTGSPTFGEWRTVRLDAEQHTGLFVCEGLAQGFMALADDTVLLYLCSDVFNPSRERGIHPLDPELGIEWPAGIEPDLSKRDSTAPTLAEAGALGQLPSYAECIRYARPGVGAGTAQAGR